MKKGNSTTDRSIKQAGEMGLLESITRGGTPEEIPSFLPDSPDRTFTF
jgi:hypothetical protein